MSVFRQLTKAPTPLREASLTMLPVRHRIGNSDEETAHRPTDAPGLLFYYLFEDWFTTYSLVTRREHGYAAELDRLVRPASTSHRPLLTPHQRREMLVRANLSHVDQLHHIGCQLSVLKRVYLAYELIIERVLKRQEATLASLKNSHIVTHSGIESLASSIPINASGPQIPEADSLLGVSLSSAARARFERLKDRIKLYALSEIQECIDQKDSLVMMVCPIRTLLLPNFLADTAPELQPHRHQGILQRRAPHARHAPACQSHHGLHARDADDGILLDPVCGPRVHGQELLVGVRGGVGGQHGVAVSV